MPARKTIADYYRLNNSVNGNPRYRVTLADGSPAQTQSDASFCYAIGNIGLREDDEVNVTFSRTGRITDMNPARFVSRDRARQITRRLAGWRSSGVRPSRPSCSTTRAR